MRPSKTIVTVEPVTTIDQTVHVLNDVPSITGRINHVASQELKGTVDVMSIEPDPSVKTSVNFAVSGDYDESSRLKDKPDITSRNKTKAHKQSSHVSIHTDTVCSTITEGNIKSKVHNHRSMKDARSFQNLKTAIMLFVVAVVYIITFLPAMLMVNQHVPMYLPVLYLYYTNNAANPIIYGFMNPNFQADIKSLFLKSCTGT